jgi:hypothetical protein
MSVAVIDGTGTSKSFAARVDNTGLIYPIHDVRIGNYGNLDAFSRLQTASPTPRFDSHIRYGKYDLQWNVQKAGGGNISHDADMGYLTLSVTNGSLDYYRLQSKDYIRYQPGYAQNIFVSFIMGTGQANTYKRVGYFDDDDGYFFQEHNGDLSFVIRSSTSGTPSDTNALTQANWNIDPLDGTGPSGITLDLSKINILVIGFQALYAGKVYFGFDIDGEIVWAASFAHANEIGSPYIANATLPVRCEIANSAAAAGSSTLIYVCSSVNASGGSDDEKGYPFTCNTGTSAISVSTRRPVLSVRPALTFNSVKNHVKFVLESITVYAQSTPVLFEIVYDGTLTGESLVAVDSTFSAFKYDKTATAISGGRILYSDYVPSNDVKQPNTKSYQKLKIDLSINMGATLDTETDLITIVCTGIGGTSSVFAAFNWKEVH